jgi:hypothetical protein
MLLNISSNILWMHLISCYTLIMLGLRIKLYSISKSFLLDLDYIDQNLGYNIRYLRNKVVLQ